MKVGIPGVLFVLAGLLVSAQAQAVEDEVIVNGNPLHCIYQTGTDIYCQTSIDEGYAGYYYGSVEWGNTAPSYIRIQKRNIRFPNALCAYQPGLPPLVPVVHKCWTMTVGPSGGEINFTAISASLVVDTDNDRHITSYDNCSSVSNQNQLNTDGDTQGDVCDTDDDNDGMLDPGGVHYSTSFGFSSDPKWSGGWSTNFNDTSAHTPPLMAKSNCYLTNCDAMLTFTFNVPTNAVISYWSRSVDAPESSADQLQFEIDGSYQGFHRPPTGSWVQRSINVSAGSHTFVWKTNGDQYDLDDVSIIPSADNCPLVANSDQLNSDGDSQGNVCDTDDDNDGDLDGADNCPLASNADQLNTDADAEGNTCDNDDDNDGMTDSEEISLGTDPLVVDTDHDYIADGQDYCPTVWGDPEGYWYYLPGQHLGCPYLVPVVQPTPYDFDNDGDGDILLRNPSTGQNNIWLLQNGAKVSVSTLTTNALTFDVAAILDGDNDGDTDILWYDSVQGKLIFWQMENGVKQANAFLGNTTATLEAVGDFDGDGDADILLTTSAGDVKIWTLQNLALVLSTNIGTPGGTYQIIDTGDFNGDGIKDIVMQDASGAVRIWQLNASAQLENTLDVATINAAYQLKKSGDTDNDGDDDLVFRNDTTGQTLVWVMQNSERQQQNVFSALNPAMTLSTVTDFDKDGDEDLMFRDITAGDASDGDTIVWKMENNIKESNSFLGNNAVTFLLASTLDMDGDGDFDILYRDNITGQILGWNMEAGAKAGNYNLGNPGLTWEPRF